MTMDTAFNNQISERELSYMLALLRMPGMGPRRMDEWLDLYPQLERVFKEPAKVLYPQHRRPEILNYLASPAWGEVERDLKWRTAPGCHIVAKSEAGYPPLLKTIHNPPPVLFVKGDLNVLIKRQVALVGSRNPSRSGRQAAVYFAAGLVEAGVVVTSGLALGIDGLSHEAALKAAGETVAVLGSGLDRIYPKSHIKLAEAIVEQGALVSEYGTGVAPVASNFPRRNRIISGLTAATVVIEASLKSGSLITAKLALEQGREVFALPGTIFNPLSKGCHALIKEGAPLIESPADILQQLFWPTAGDGHFPKQAQQPILAGNEKLVWQALDWQTTTIDEVVARSGLGVETVTATLLNLELQGFIVPAAGGYLRKFR